MSNYYFSAICHHSNTIKRTISEYGDKPLYTFLKHFTAEPPISFQDREDLFKVIQDSVAPLLGKTIAHQAALDLKRSPIVLTANHHGVDFFAQSVQGSLFFFLKSLVREELTKTSIVFSFGNVPLNNLTFPRGLLLYDVTVENLESIPQKIPIFPEQYKRKMVSVSPSFNQKMVLRAQNKLNQLDSDKVIRSALASTAKDILQHEYLQSGILNQPDYSKQSIILNNHLWKYLFSPATVSSELVYLEIEKIVIKLLELDLLNPESLTWRVMFDPKLRENLLDELNGVKGCWNREQLNENYLKNCSTKSSVGTIFFWGIDQEGRRFPLCLELESFGKESLFGIDDVGNPWRICYGPESIIKNLEEQRISPSLFTCFLAVCFARGITCIGGYYQAEYLPQMQQGLISALNKTEDYHHISILIDGITTDYYLSGMQTVMGMVENNYLVPAGPIEIIAKGGLTKTDLDKILSVTVKEAHLASLFETLPDIAPWEIKSREWKKSLAFSYRSLLGNKLVNL